MPYGYAQTIQVARAEQLTDAAGVKQPQRDWDNATPIEITGVSVQPAGSVEVRDDAGIRQVDTYRIYSPRGADLDLQPGDRITIDVGGSDVVMEVTGTPQRFPAPGGGIHHAEATARVLPLTSATAVGSAATLRAAAAGAAGQARQWSPQA